MIKAKTRLTPGSAHTREQLLLTGERLFAQQGFDNVSLRQINSSAGQRNSSASHYHFGSKEALINAIYEYRMERFNVRRSAMLAALPPSDQPRPVVSLIKILVYPMVEEAEESAGGRNTMRFLSQLFCHPTLNLVDMWRSQFSESIGQVYYKFRRALPDLPDEIFGHRFGLMWLLAVKALADRERLNTATEGLISYTLPVLFVSNLVDTLAGMLAAPVSADTQAEIVEIRSRGQRLA